MREEEWRCKKRSGDERRGVERNIDTVSADNQTSECSNRRSAMEST